MPPPVAAVVCVPPFGRRPPGWGLTRSPFRLGFRLATWVVDAATDDCWLHGPPDFAAGPAVVLGRPFVAVGWDAACVHYACPALGETP